VQCSREHTSDRYTAGKLVNCALVSYHDGWDGHWTAVQCCGFYDDQCCCIVPQPQSTLMSRGTAGATTMLVQLPTLSSTLVTLSTWRWYVSPLCCHAVITRTSAHPKTFVLDLHVSSEALSLDAVDWACLVLAIWTMFSVFAVHTAWGR